jgi:hemolysin D
MLPARKVIVFPKKMPPRREYELAFLPAALEITETPASPIGRAVGATVIVVFCAALAWACLGSVDIVASAIGKIVPSGRTKLIQPLEIGVVRAINVHDGQSVKAGDVLVELDPTVTNAEEGHLKGDRVAAELDVARLRAALLGGADPLVNFAPPVGASPAQIEMHRQFLVSLVAELNAKLAEVDRQQQQKEAERASVAATIVKLEATTPVLQERVDVRKGLYDKGLGSRLIYLTEYQDLVSMQQDLLVQRSHLREAEAASAALKETRAKAVAEYRHSLFDDLAKAEQKEAALEQDVLKAERRTKLQLLTAPVDGIVQQLAVHTVGGVVTPAQVLAVLVPSDSNLEIEAKVSNRDIGFVHTGQEVEIKVDTFSFTRYGLLHGKVINVSQDAIAVDKPQDKSNETASGGLAGTSEPRGQELNYIARVSLDRIQMQVEDGSVSLGPGMAVTVEIKTGSRRIINYLLSPLVKYKNEALRER